MRYMSKILEPSTTDATGTPSTTTTSSTSLFSRTTTAASPSSASPSNMFDESLNLDLQNPSTDGSLGIRNELHEILSNLPGSGIITVTKPTITSPMTTCPATCTCSCPGPSVQLPSVTVDNPAQGNLGVKVTDQSVQSSPHFVLEQMDPNDGGSSKKVDLGVSLLPCARTATYQLNLALKLCRK